MNKKEALNILEKKVNELNDPEITRAWGFVERITEHLERRLEMETSENTIVKDFLYGGHLGKKYHDFPDSTLYIGTEFEVGGAYENWGFVVKKWDVVEKRLKPIAAERTLKKVIEKAIKNLNK